MEASTADILVLEAFEKVVGSLFPSPSAVTSSISFPKFPPDVLSTLIDLAMTRFQNQSTVIEIPLGTYIIGDIHGNIHDLLRILGTIGDFLPRQSNVRDQSINSDVLLTSDGNLIDNSEIQNQTKLLFLGNYIGQGQFSLEVITLLFALTVAYPNNFYLIRGCDEFKDTNEQSGFKSELVSEYGRKNDIYDRLNKAFSYLPLAAIVGGSTICIHGGLSSKLSMTSQIQSIQRPLKNCENILVSDLLWSNPSTDTMTYKASYDGKGCFFGQQSTSLFLKNNRYIRIIRGHQCNADGVQPFFNGLGFTVFSSSNSDSNCLIGFIRINLKNKVIIYRLPQSTEKYDRSKTVFQSILDEVQMTFSNVLKMNYFTYKENNTNDDSNNKNDCKNRTTFKCCKNDFLLYPSSLSSTFDSKRMLKKKRASLSGNITQLKASTLPPGFILANRKPPKTSISSSSMARLPKKRFSDNISNVSIKGKRSSSAKLPTL